MIFYFYINNIIDFVATKYTENSFVLVCNFNNLLTVKDLSVLNYMGKALVTSKVYQDVNYVT